jgi:hypothetical protein
LQRVVVPGAAELTLSEPGRYTVFHEWQSTVGNTFYRADDISGMTVTVVEAAGGREVALRAPGMQGRYNLGGHSGVSVLEFDVATAGGYRLGAAYADGRAEPLTVLAVGRNFAGDLVATILGTVAFALAGLGSAVPIFVVTLLKRRSAMERAAGT